MSNADRWFFEIAFAVFTVLLLEGRVRMKRIEEKLDKLTSSK
jgi:hypothetical protein